MNQFLRSLTPTEQVAALFLIVFGLLVVVSVTAFLLTLRDRADIAASIRCEFRVDAAHRLIV